MYCPRRTGVVLAEQNLRNLGEVEMNLASFLLQHRMKSKEIAGVILGFGEDSFMKDGTATKQGSSDILFSPFCLPIISFRPQERQGPKHGQLAGVQRVNLQDFIP